MSSAFWLVSQWRGVSSQHTERTHFSIPTRLDK